VQQVIAAAKAGEWRVGGDGEVIAGGVRLEPEEYDLVLESGDPDTAISFLGGDGFIVLDTHLTPELEAEGVARDVVRAVQQARRDAGLDVSDRIVLLLAADAATVAAIEAHRDLIAGETLATTLAAREAEGEMVIELERA
jgi:isoleucyl-tRNA synthetase